MLIYDGHNSHITYPTVRAAIENNISIVCLPPHTSHALQVLDVAVFRAFKVNYSEVCREWFKTSGCRTVCKATFPALLKKVWNKLDPIHVINGFKKTGLYPLDKSAVDAKIIRDPSKSGEPSKKKKTPVDHMIQALSNIIKPPISTEDQETIDNAKKPRKRVQSKSGEILTSAVVASRLQDELKEREEKKRRKCSAATPKGKKSVNINLRSKRVPASKVAKGTLDSFVTRTKNRSIEGQHASSPELTESSPELAENSPELAEFP